MSSAAVVDQPDVVVRVYLLDRQGPSRRTTQRLLRGRSGLDLIGEYREGTLLPDDILRRRPDVLLVNAGPPAPADIELSREATSRWPNLRVVVMADADNLTARLAAVLAGAAAVVFTDDPPDVMCDVLQRVAAGEVLISAADATHVLDQAMGVDHGDDAAPAYPPRPLPLGTPDQVLRALVADGLTNREIAHLVKLPERIVAVRLQAMTRRLLTASAASTAGTDAERAVVWRAALRQPTVDR